MKIRTVAEIMHARAVVHREYEDLNLHEVQRAIFAGMSAALQWMMGEGSTMERLLSGELVDPKTDEQVRHIEAESRDRVRKLRGGT